MSPFSAMSQASLLFPFNVRNTERALRDRPGITFAKAVKITLLAFLGLGTVSFTALFSIILYYVIDMPNVGAWKVPVRPPNMKILSAEGELIGNRGLTGGAFVAIETLPTYIPGSVVAIEDHRFYSHHGVDPVGISRAIAVNISKRRFTQGGSTITQQLAKNLFLTPERSLRRKAQEVALALWLELHYDKQHILEMYLNRVYFGGGAYGLEAAAHYYFDKPARYLNMKEAAMLAGMLKGPNFYSPHRDLDRSLARTKLVLQRMAEVGQVSPMDAETAMTMPLKISSKNASHNLGSEGYVADWVESLVPNYLNGFQGDVIVRTTLSLKEQRQAEKAVREGIDKWGKKYHLEQAALVSIDTNGAVRALVGGYDYNISQFNRATKSQRQPGSSFKPFVYVTALEGGLGPYDMRPNNPISIQGWVPKNSGNRYSSAATLIEALSRSYNTVSARLTFEFGPENVVRTAHRLGIRSDLQAHPSIALGTSEVNLLELTGAYVPFANDGIGVEPFIIDRITSENNAIVYQHAYENKGRVLDPYVLGMINLMLYETMITGTGREAQLKTWMTAGKTGTTQNSRDAWFIGYTGFRVTGVWVGNDDNTPTRASGANVPSLIWKRFMEPVHKGVRQFDIPSSEQFEAISGSYDLVRHERENQFFTTNERDEFKRNRNRNRDNPEREYYEIGSQRPDKRIQELPRKPLKKDTRQPPKKKMTIFDLFR